MALIKVDFPALGRPTSPTSASSFSRSHTHISSPGQPMPCWRGARLVLVLWLALPRPPSPPPSSTSRCPALTTSAIPCAPAPDRTEERLGGTGRVATCSSRRLPNQYTNKN